MSGFRVLVVDDEPLARQAVVSLLRGDQEIEAIEECEDGAVARTAIERARPDIVFLDIEMPGVSGLELAGGLPGSAPVLIFTTAFSRYAVEAFDVAATDYILKPFSDERFVEALTRAKRRVRERRLGALAHQMASVAAELQPEDVPPGQAVASPYLQRLSLRHAGGSIVLRTEEIVWIEAEDYCVRVHSTRGSHLIRASLASLETQLDPKVFARTHRTAIVNLLHVRETDERDGLRLILSDGSQVAVSRSRKTQIESLLSPRLR